MSKLATWADRLGYDYTSIPNFPMKWYETYGLHTKDYLFDRFTPRGIAQQAVLILARSLWWLLYILPFGLWLTFAGRAGSTIYDTYLELTGKKPEMPENPYLNED